LERKVVSGIMLTLILVCMLYTIFNVRLATSWSNGGFSTDPLNPNYGTHDWIAQHALDWLPSEEKQYISDNLAAYLFGTELPDGGTGGIGDVALHHIYYYANGSLQDDASAIRAQEEYNNALNFLKDGDFGNAAKYAGIMSHYIVDMAVFGHVMASGTDWGAEVHHSDYESYVNTRTDSYVDDFNVYLAFDGSLDSISANTAAKELAYDTTFDFGGDLICVWMDRNYNWSNPTFKDRCGESLNLAVNYLADVLHTLYLEAVPWPMFRHDLRHTGYSYQKAPNTNQTLWTYTTGSWVTSSPAVAGGKVFIGSYDNKVYALNASTGAYIWSYTTGNLVHRSSPAVADGKVYIGSCDGKVYALNASTGALIWNYTTGSELEHSSPAVADGKVYIGSGEYDGKVYALNASTGALIWNYTTEGAVYSSPAIADGKVYIGSGDGKVYALNASTGALIWNYTTGYLVKSSPAVADNKVFIGSYDSKVYALNASTGALIWNYTAGDDVESSPAVADGRVFIGSDDGKVYALNASNGALIWNYTIGGYVSYVPSSPAVADGKVYIGSYDSKVYALNASTGALIWNYTTGHWVDSSPAVADGKVYIGSCDGKVYAFADHDVAVTDVAISKTLIGRGYTTPIRAYITNRGYRTETFNVTAYANSTIIERKTITLTSRDTLATTFTWNTTGWAKSNYTISVIADTIPGEANTADNTFIDGIVKVGCPGDMNNDGKCNILDLVKVAGKFGTSLGDPNYDPNYDFNDDNKVNILDLVKVAGKFGTTDP